MAFHSAGSAPLSRLADKSTNAARHTKACHDAGSAPVMLLRASRTLWLPLPLKLPHAAGKKPETVAEVLCRGLWAAGEGCSKHKPLQQSWMTCKLKQIQVAVHAAVRTCKVVSRKVQLPWQWLPR